MSSPKPDSPTYYWLRHSTELQDILTTDDPRYDEVLAFLYADDLEFLTVADFCITEPGNPSDISLSDLSDGSYLEKYRRAARQAAFYRLCQD